jgi:protein gp37
MAKRSNIEWTDSTWNPWIGCTKVSPACDNCYAEADFDIRRGRVKWGAGQPRSRTKTWGDPVRWNKKPFCECSECGWRGERTNAVLANGLRCPDCGMRGSLVVARRRVFCASLADVFDNEVDPAWRAELFHLIEETPNLDWLLLTKRIGNAAKMMNEARLSLVGSSRLIVPEVLPNVWIGATICNQEEADRDIPKLLEVQAGIRFVSIEPILGPIDLTRISLKLFAATANALTGKWKWENGPTKVETPPINWVIAGGESGRKARPAHPEWFRSLQQQCAAAEVPFLFKQWGEFAPGDQAACGVQDAYEESRTGGWVEPDGTFAMGEASSPKSAGANHVFAVGKQRSGNALDGVTYKQFPSSRQESGNPHSTAGIQRG